MVSLGIRFEAETHVCFLINSVVSAYTSTKNEQFYWQSFLQVSIIQVNVVFFYLGFISRPFTNHRTEWKEKDISLFPDYHFHPHQRHLDISQAITAESLHLHIASSRIRNGTFGFRVQVTNQYLKQRSVLQLWCNQIGQRRRNMRPKCGTMFK